MKTPPKYAPRLCDNPACRRGQHRTRKTFTPTRPHQLFCSTECRYETWAAVHRAPKPRVTT